MMRFSSLAGRVPEVVSVAILFFAPVVALCHSETGSACRDLLGRGSGIKLDREHNPSSERSVRIGSSEPGRHGGKRYRLTRIGDSWNSDYTQHRFVVHGNPGWFLEVYGEKAGDFFGFKKISDRELLVPDAAEFNGALRKVKDWLKTKKKRAPQIQFYETVENPGVDWKENYLRRFAEGISLPIGKPDAADAGLAFIHDLSFHVPTAILLSPEVLKLAAAQTETLLLFYDWAKKKHSKDLANPKSANKKIFEVAFVFQMILIDVNTAKLVRALASGVSRVDTNKQDLLRDQIQNNIRKLIDPDRSASASRDVDWILNSAYALVGQFQFFKQSWQEESYLGDREMIEYLKSAVSCGDLKALGAVDFVLFDRVFVQEFLGSLGGSDRKALEIPGTGRRKTHYLGAEELREVTRQLIPSSEDSACDPVWELYSGIREAVEELSQDLAK